MKEEQDTFSPSAVFYLSACTMPPPPPAPELEESFPSPSAKKIIKAGILLVAKESNLQTTYRRERHGRLSCFLSWAQKTMSLSEAAEEAGRRIG